MYSSHRNFSPLDFPRVRDYVSTHSHLRRFRLSRFHLHPILYILTIVGSHIISAALQRGCTVLSISRRPPARFAAAVSLSDVNFLSADIFSPATYRDELKHCDAVVYSAGILLEGEYKAVLEKPTFSSLLGLLAQRPWDRNPLKSSSRTGYNGLHREGGIVFVQEIEKMY
jgi:hypothetical protein